MDLYERVVRLEKSKGISLTPPPKNYLNKRDPEGEKAHIYNGRKYRRQCVIEGREGTYSILRTFPQGFKVVPCGADSETKGEIVPFEQVTELPVVIDP